MADKLVKIGMPPRERWGENVEQPTSCDSCEYLKDREKMLCGNPDFIAWAGPNKPAKSDKIPATDPKKYCSIWWDQKDEEQSEEEFGGEYRYRRGQKK